MIDVVADRGYFKIEDIEACEKAGCIPHVPRPQRGSSVREGFFRKDEFRYDAGRDAYVCPVGKVLTPTRLAHPLPEQDRSRERNRPLHRRLLQSRPPPFGARLHQPASVRTAGSAKSKTLSTNAGQVHARGGWLRWSTR
jgi:hypothetical protein